MSDLAFPELHMAFREGTVFVLGAGFTRAFLPDAPLLIDHCYGEELQRRVANLPYASAVLDAELKDPAHLGEIDIERLMTRIAGGMPYDFGAELDQPIGATHALDYLLVEVTNAFIRRLREGCQTVRCRGELWLFSQHVCENRNHCITFNY